MANVKNPNIFQNPYHTAHHHHRNTTQDSTKGYLFAPSAGFGLLSALILTFPPEYRPGILEAKLDLTLVPATLGAVVPAVEDTGTVFRFEAVSGTLGAVGLLSGLIRTLPSACFLFCSGLLFAAVEYELPLGL
jgi:hypothetical protein